MSPQIGLSTRHLLRRQPGCSFWSMQVAARLSVDRAIIGSVLHSQILSSDLRLYHSCNFRSDIRTWIIMLMTQRLSISLPMVATLYSVALRSQWFFPITTHMDFAPRFLMCGWRFAVVLMTVFTVFGAVLEYHRLSVCQDHLCSRSDIVVPWKISAFDRTFRQNWATLLRWTIIVEMSELLNHTLEFLLVYDDIIFTICCNLISSQPGICLCGELWLRIRLQLLLLGHLSILTGVCICGRLG